MEAPQVFARGPGYHPDFSVHLEAIASLVVPTGLFMGKSGRILRV